MNKLPEWQCHKRVNAAKIVGITEDAAGHALNLGEFGVTFVTSQWLTQHGAKPGGYYVVYSDGYASYSPASAFEGGYTLTGKPTHEQLREATAAATAS